MKNGKARSNLKNEKGRNEKRMCAEKIKKEKESAIQCRSKCDVASSDRLQGTLYKEINREANNASFSLFKNIYLFILIYPLM